MPVRSRSASLTVSLLIALSLLLVLAVFAPLWPTLLLAALVAAAARGPYERLARALHRREGAALLCTLLLVLLVLGPVTYLVAVAVGQGQSAAAFARDTLQRGGLSGALHLLPDRLQPAAEDLLGRLRLQSEQLSARAIGGAFAALGTVQAALSFTSTALLDLVLVLIAFYFFLCDGPAATQWLIEALPLEQGETRALLHDAAQAGRSIVRSLVVTALLQGLAAGVGYLLAGVPQPVFFGLFTFVAAFVPSGPTLLGLPLAGLLFLTGHTLPALFLAVWMLAVVGSVDSFVKPLLMRGGVRIHSGIVFFSILGGIFLLGAKGILVGPLAVAVLEAVVRLAHGRSVAAPAPEAMPDPHAAEIENSSEDTAA